MLKIWASHGYHLKKNWLSFKNETAKPFLFFKKGFLLGYSCCWLQSLRKLVVFMFKNLSLTPEYFTRITSIRVFREGVSDRRTLND